METATQADFGTRQRALRDALLALLPSEGEYPTPISNVSVCRRNGDDRYFHPMVYEPMFLIVAQGAQKVRMGQHETVYGENSYFVAGVDMPATCAITDVSPEHPFLSLRLKLDKTLLAQLADETPPQAAKGLAHDTPHIWGGAVIASLDPDFLDAALRLVGLLAAPRPDSVLARMVLSEIHYRLLIGPFGPQLRAISSLGTPDHSIAKAIHWLRENYDKALKVDELAARFNMATSTFHKHFKAITAMSPLQFQKRLRLEQAHRLLLHQRCDVSIACFAVGYASTQQFSREYRRLFGYPPGQAKHRRHVWPLMRAGQMQGS